MSVGIKILGIPAKQVTGDEATLKFASTVKVDDKPLKFIHLGLKEKVVSGKMNFRVNCFQTAVVVVDTTKGTRKASLTKDNNGKDATLYPTPFNYDPENFGARTAYIPDTEFNRQVLIEGFHGGVSYEIHSESVQKEVKTKADARKKRFDNAKEKAWDQARKEVGEEMATFVKGLKDKIGDGYELSHEYKENVGKKVNALGRKLFTDNNSWKEAPKKPNA